MTRKLRVAIDCRITDFQQGIGTAVQALAKALSDSDIEDQEYAFIVLEGLEEQLAPYVYGPCRIETIPASRLSGVKAALRWIAPLRWIWKMFRDASLQIPVSDGYVESHQFDVVHFPTQVAYMTELPTIYQPHDLQHIHYPEYFSNSEFAQRERNYRAFCNQATFVCVHAEWTKQDIVKQYNLAAEKIEVVKWGMVFDACRSPSSDERKSTVQRYGLPDQFFFYPAATWPHKNHECIIRSLHILKEEHGLTPDLFCTGASTAFRRTLDRMARESGIFQQVHYLGFVDFWEMQAIYEAAMTMIYPSRFEGFGLPILEAFHAGVPVLCSNATVLPEIAQSGALYFDPGSPAELSVLMKTMLRDKSERERLVKKGKLVLLQYSFRDTARRFQALYERSVPLHKEKSSLAVPTLQ